MIEPGFCGWAVEPSLHVRHHRRAVRARPGKELIRIADVVHGSRAGRGTEVDAGLPTGRAPTVAGRKTGGAIEGVVPGGVAGSGRGSLAAGKIRGALPPIRNKRFSVIGWFPFNPRTSSTVKVTPVIVAPAGILSAMSKAIRPRRMLIVAGSWPSWFVRPT